MDYVYLLVSLSVMLLIGAVCGILWAVKSDQFEDFKALPSVLLWMTKK
jgi:cbb3-type cytochrome oxidase maturation protein